MIVPDILWRFINQAYIPIIKKLFKHNYLLNITQLTYGYKK